MNRDIDAWLEQRPAGAKPGDAAFDEWLARKPVTWRDYWDRIDDPWKILGAFALLYLALHALGIQFVPE